MFSELGEITQSESAAIHSCVNGGCDSHITPLQKHKIDPRIPVYAFNNSVCWDFTTSSKSAAKWYSQLTKGHGWLIHMGSVINIFDGAEVSVVCHFPKCAYVYSVKYAPI